MADVRSLLRQQRAARRITHPHASYSDSGKLLCTLCHEHIKTESLWDTHLRSAAHRQRLTTHQPAPANGASEPTAPTAPLSQEPIHSHKRKLDDDDEDMPDAPETAEGRLQRKRRRPEGVPKTATGQNASSESARRDDTSKTGSKPTTPPLLPRRASGTPVLGVEMQIPSRPATPNAAGREASGSTSAAGTSVTSTPRLNAYQSPSLAAPTAVAPRQVTLEPSPLPDDFTGVQAAPKAPPPIDEDEWAAFEAEMVGGAPANPTAGLATVPSDAVIAAPAMTADEVAAQARREEDAKRRARAEIELEDDKEEASRALETEFEEMEELEARVRKLKERREALRQTTGPAAGAPAKPAAEKVSDGGESKENGPAAEEEDDEEEDEDEDDWAGFRFRA